MFMFICERCGSTAALPVTLMGSVAVCICASCQRDFDEYPNVIEAMMKSNELRLEMTLALAAIEAGQGDPDTARKCLADYMEHDKELKKISREWLAVKIAKR